jgi:hypothetical protein
MFEMLKTLIWNALSLFEMATLIVTTALLEKSELRFYKFCKSCHKHYSGNRRFWGTVTVICNTQYCIIMLYNQKAAFVGGYPNLLYIVFEVNKSYS